MVIIETECFGCASQALFTGHMKSELEIVIELVQHMRRAAVSTLSTAAHNKPELVKDLLPTLLPLLYDQTVVKVFQSTFQQFLGQLFPLFTAYR
jgi:hypothetical protein